MQRWGEASRGRGPLLGKVLYPTKTAATKDKKVTVGLVVLKLTIPKKHKEYIIIQNYFKKNKK